MNSSSTSAARRIGRVILVGVVAAITVALTSHIGLPSTPAEARALGDAPLTLVHQDFVVAPDALLSIQFRPPGPIDGATVTVRAYRPITLREELKKAIGGELSGFIDQVAIDPAAVVVDTDGNIRVDVQTESATNTGTSLRLASAGLYPLIVSATTSSGEEVGQLLTFVYRTPAPDDPQLGQVSVAVLASVTAPPATSPESLPLPAAVTAQLAELGSYSPDVEVSLAISPEILGRIDQATLGALQTSLANSMVMSQPLVPFDPSSATASELDEQFDKLLIAGEDAVTDSGLPRASRDVWYAPDSITKAGALLLRTAGVRTLVISPDTYLQANGNLGDITDYSQLFKTVIVGAEDSSSDETCEAASGSMTCMPTAVVDPLLASRFTDTSLSDEQAAVYTAADVVVYREQFSDSISPSLRHALVLGLDGEGVPNHERMNRSVQMLSATGAVNFITLDDLDQSSSALINDGRQIELDLPDPAVTQDLRQRSKDLSDVRLAVTTVASMLVDDRGRYNAWINTIERLYSTSISDDQVAGAISVINTELAAIRACVVPPDSYPFTLTGKSTNLPLPFTNLCTEPLQVIVRLTAAANKLDFPEGDQTVVLEPEATKLVQVPVTARTNGSFNVSLEVLTPTGEFDVTEPVTLNASINALTGLPQLITGAALLILLTWWVRHLRRSRRQRRGIEGRTEHPATRTEPA